MPILTAKRKAEMLLPLTGTCKVCFSPVHRSTGSKYWFHDNPDSNVATIAREVKLDIKTNASQ